MSAVHALPGPVAIEASPLFFYLCHSNVATLIDPSAVRLTVDMFHRKKCVCVCSNLQANPAKQFEFLKRKNERAQKRHPKPCALKCATD